MEGEGLGSHGGPTHSQSDPLDRAPVSEEAGAGAAARAASGPADGCAQPAAALEQPEVPDDGGGPADAAPAGEEPPPAAAGMEALAARAELLPAVVGETDASPAEAGVVSGARDSPAPEPSLGSDSVEGAALADEGPPATAEPHAGTAAADLMPDASSTAGSSPAAEPAVGSEAGGSLAAPLAATAGSIDALPQQQSELSGAEAVAAAAEPLPTSTGASSPVAQLEPAEAAAEVPAEEQMEAAALLAPPPLPPASSPPPAAAADVAPAAGEDSLAVLMRPAAPTQQQHAVAETSPPAAVPAQASTSAAAAAAAAAAGLADPPEEDVAALPPDHPLLRRAQKALYRQLAEQKLRLEEELRERRKALKDAKQRREDVGVELYGFQQHLAKLQLALEKAGEAHSGAARARAEADSALAALRAQVAEAEAATAGEDARAEALQGELDGLNGTLRAIQAHNEAVAGELAVAKRTAYATEAGVVAAEKAKREQDFLIEGMQAQLRRLAAAATARAAAIDGQRGQTHAAQEMLAQALANMEGVAFEKKQLLSQWRASLVAMQQRDTQLEALQENLRQAAERRTTMANEREGFLRQLAQQAQRNEAAGEVQRKLEGQAARLAAQVERVRAKNAELKEGYMGMQRQLAERQEALAAAAAEAAKLASQRAQLEREQARVAAEAAAVDKTLLDRLGEQTFAEKGSAATLREVERIRAACADKEVAADAARAQLERLGEEAQNVDARNARLSAVLGGLEGTLADKAAGVAALEAEMRAGHQEVEARTRALDQLNRRYQRLLDNFKDVETGPLEATIANLQREIAAKQAAGRNLQRRWMGVQGTLVAAQAANAELAEAVAGMRAQQAVMSQKRQRLNGQLETQQREAKALAKALDGLHAETARLNGLLADASGLRSTLREGNLLLEGKLAAELKALEARWSALNGSIDELRAERGEVAAAVVEAEREVLVWERRVQLEKEMQEAVDPQYGGEELAGLRKEVQRLAHAAGELAREQEALVGEMERAVAKREVIGTKARLSQSTKIQDAAKAAAKRQADELARAAAAKEREGRAAEAALAALDGEIAQAQAAAEEAGEQCAALAAAEVAVQGEIEALGAQKLKALVATTAKQREVKKYEEAAAGKYKPAAPPTALAGGDAAAALSAEVERARKRQAKIQAAVQGLAAGSCEEVAPAVAPQLERALAHVAALCE